MEKFDIIIIGSGPAGFSAAMRSIDMNKHVCIIEKSALGGAGVFHGALTSKTLWHLSEDYAIAANVERGYRASGLQVDFRKVLKSVRAAAQIKVYQIKSQIETLTKGRFADKSLTLKHGHASFIDQNTIEIVRGDTSEKIQADNFIIATGSRPRLYPGIEVDHQRIITSNDIFNLKEFPEKMVIVGSGIIGSEFATIFSNFKQTEVHLLDRQHRVIPFEDDDVSDFVSQNLENNGVIIHHTANLRTIRKEENSLEVVLDYDDGHSQVIEVDVAFIAIGRIPNTDNLGLKNIGVTPTKNGHLTIDDRNCVYSELGYTNIFAAGDITGQTQLYSVAEMQGRYAVRGVYNKINHPISYYNMPTLMFFKPEVVAVGLNEKTLREMKIPYKMVFYSNALINRALAMRNTNGFIKILASNDGEERILGMRAAGPQASAFIVSIAHIMNQKNSVDQVLKTIHPHPSITEGIQDCLRILKGKSIFKPFAFPDLIKTASWAPRDE
ncbi:MAG: NAD(P)/FAD-dependent oxidoreductase [Bacteroidales bacterium]|nr:NAD(P)/FAD-dependent oxidoreductase [Bacteroidales bacterium]